MNTRRDFLKHLGIGTAAMAVGPAVLARRPSIATAEPSTVPDAERRVEFLGSLPTGYSMLACTSYLGASTTSAALSGSGAQQ